MTQALPKDVPQTLRRWRPYPAYKDSSVEWLVEIPKHWEVMPLKRCLKSYDYGLSDNIKGEGTFKVLTMGHIQDGKVMIPTEGSLENVPKELILEQGDLLFNRTNSRELVGKVGIFQGNLEDKITFASYLVRLKTNNSAKSLYLNFLLNSQLILSKVRQDALLSINQANLNPTKYCQIRIPLPPIEEQQAIASFLDRETTKIDALIAKKERLIELLQEKRTAIISHAVTKGLDPTVPLEDSGVDWLGEVPAHWKVLSVRRLAGMIEQGWSPVAEDRLASEDEWGVIKLSAVSQGLFRPEEHKTLPEDMEADQRYEIKAGDFLVTRANTPNLVGDVCVVSNIRPHLMLCDLVYRVSVDDNRVSRNYLCYWFLCRAGRYQITRDARGSSLSMVKVSQNSIRSWLVALPPFLEQQAIASYLDSETAKIEALIAKICEGIEKLKEYRTALISAAVTGKIDVRNEIAS